jgi:hypothetical protein
MTDNVQKAESASRSALTAAGWGLLVFLLSVGAQWLVYEKVLHDAGGMRLISPAIAAIVAALLALRLHVMERDRARATVRALQTIADMNHHIRNALQVISYESYTSAESNQHIREAVNKIEWTLREVLPGFRPTDVREPDVDAHPKSRRQAR